MAKIDTFFKVVFIILFIAIMLEISGVFNIEKIFSPDGVIDEIPNHDTPLSEEQIEALSTEGTWNFFCYVNNGSIGSLYINGVEDETFIDGMGYYEVFNDTFNFENVTTFSACLWISEDYQNE